MRKRQRLTSQPPSLTLAAQNLTHAPNRFAHEAPIASTAAKSLARESPTPTAKQKNTEPPPSPPNDGPQRCITHPFRVVFLRPPPERRGGRLGRAGAGPIRGVLPVSSLAGVQGVTLAPRGGAPRAWAGERPPGPPALKQPWRAEKRRVPSRQASGQARPSRR